MKTKKLGRGVWEEKKKQKPWAELFKAGLR